MTEGQQITFDNFDAADQNVWHSITACKAPCTGSTGIAYPLADADVQFDSGQLGNGGAAHRGHHDLEHAGRPRRRAPTPTSAASTPSCAARSGWSRRRVVGTQVARDHQRVGAHLRRGCPRR